MPERFRCTGHRECRGVWREGTSVLSGTMKGTPRAASPEQGNRDFRSLPPSSAPEVSGIPVPGSEGSHQLLPGEEGRWRTANAEEAQQA